MLENHITKEEFWIEFFGNFGHELGDPNAKFTDNPTDIIQFVKDCADAKKPAFISVNPRLAHDVVIGIEKLFFDFDSEDKTYIKFLNKCIEDGKVTEEDKKFALEKRAIEVIGETREFINHLEYDLQISPMVVRTRKGFHIHVYLPSVWVLPIDNPDVLKETYNLLQIELLKRRDGSINYKYFDTSVLGDVKRLCRIPYSIHQITGQECFIVKKIIKKSDTEYEVVPDKIRGLGQYTSTPLRDFEWAFKMAVEKIKLEETLRIQKQEESKEKWEMNHGFVGKVRPCFIKQYETKEMRHKFRLAFEPELWFAGEFNGHNTKTVEGMINVFRNFNDFNEKKSREQIEWFFENVVPKFRKGLAPYSCKTIQENNWCMKNDCPLYNKRKSKNGQKRKKE
jgi:hypothetical protein